MPQGTEERREGETEMCRECRAERPGITPPPSPEGLSFLHIPFLISDEESTFPVAKHIGGWKPLLVDSLNPEMEPLSGKWQLEEPLQIVLTKKER